MPKAGFSRMATDLNDSENGGNVSPPNTSATEDAEIPQWENKRNLWQQCQGCAIGPTSYRR